MDREGEGGCKEGKKQATRVVKHTSHPFLTSMPRTMGQW